MRRLVVLTVVVLLGLCAPAAWAKGSFDSVFADYTKDGKIDPCKHSASDLQKARADIPPDIEQYAPDFPDALDAAIEARARGACAKKPKPAAAPPAAPPVTTTPAPPPSGGAAPGKPTPAPAPAAPPAPQAPAAPAGAPTDQAISKAASHDSGDSDVPAPLVGLGVLAALAILCAVALALVRWRAWEPGWAQRARHATGEAGYRVSATWAEFADWLRLGQR